MAVMDLSGLFNIMMVVCITAIGYFVGWTLANKGVFPALSREGVKVSAFLVSALIGYLFRNIWQDFHWLGSLLPVVTICIVLLVIPFLIIVAIKAITHKP